MGALPPDLALAAVLTARLDGAARPALLAVTVARVPVPRAAADDAAPSARQPAPVPARVPAAAQPAADRRS
jgi:hypothetical protein